MRKSNKFCALVLCFVLLAASVQVCKAEYTRPKNDILRELAYAFYWNTGSDNGRLGRLMEELERADEATATAWRGILDYWTYVNGELELNYNELPDGLNNDSKLCIVVLGYELYYDGTMQDELIGRMEATLKSAIKYPNAYILCTGGGTASVNTQATEAGEMARWLVENGIAESRILVEDKSMSTTQNAALSYELIREKCPEVTSLAMITSDYHIPWGILLLQAKCFMAGEGLRVVSHAAYETGYEPRYNIRDNQIMGLFELAGLG